MCLESVIFFWAQNDWCYLDWRRKTKFLYAAKLLKSGTEGFGACVANSFLFVVVELGLGLYRTFLGGK